MRRPIVYLLLAFTAGIVFQYYMNFRFIHLTLWICFAAGSFILSLIKGNRYDFIRIIRISILLIIVALSGSLFLYAAENRSDPLEEWAGQNITITGCVLTVQVKGDNNYNLLIRSNAYLNPSDDAVSRWNGKWLIRVKGDIGNPAGVIGKNVEISGKIEIPAAQRNPGLFDYKLYLKTKGIRTIINTSASQMVLLDNGNVILSKLAVVKYSFMDRLEKIMDPNAYGLLIGMLFGDRSYMSDDTYEAFQKNGIAHILSVSGIHVGIVYVYLNKLSGNRKSRLLNLIAIGMLIVYAALSDFSPSVVRAVVMIVIHILSKLTHHRYDFTTCASASALSMLVINPYYLFNTGFQLSYMAVFCLAVQLPWLNRLLDKMKENRRNEFMTSALTSLAPLLVIQLGMAPLTAYLFNYFSIASLLLNIPIIAISGIIIPIGISLIPLSYFSYFIFGVGATAAELLIKLMTILNDFFYMPGLGFFSVVSPSLGFMLSFYAFLFLLTTETMRILYQRNKFRTIAVILTIIVLVSLLISSVVDPQYHRSEMVFLDVGQGDCLHIRTPDGRNILIDAGGSSNYNVGERTLLPYLLKNKVRNIDLAIVTHFHDDHYLGMKQLSRNMKIRKFGTYQANKFKSDEIQADMRISKEDILYLKGGDRIEVGEGIWIDVLYPEAQTDEEYIKLLNESEDENKSSLLMRVNYMGLTVMMTGDIGEEGEKLIMAYYQEKPDVLKADILKVGHHGSRYSTSDEFLRHVSPKIGVVQVGRNNFGHPHYTVIEKLEKQGIILYRNDHDGAVIFDNEERGWPIRTLLQRSMHLKESIGKSKAMN